MAALSPHGLLVDRYRPLRGVLRKPKIFRCQTAFSSLGHSPNPITLPDAGTQIEFLLHVNQVPKFVQCMEQSAPSQPWDSYRDQRIGILRLFTIPDPTSPLVGQPLKNLCPNVLQFGPNLNFDRDAVYEDDYMYRSISVRWLHPAVFHFARLRTDRVESSLDAIYCFVLLSSVAENDSRSRQILNLAQAATLTPELLDQNPSGLDPSTGGVAEVGKVLLHLFKSVLIRICYGREYLRIVLGYPAMPSKTLSQTIEGGLRHW